MLILNFTHPLTPEQRAQIETLAHTSIEEIRTIPLLRRVANPLFTYQPTRLRTRGFCAAGGTSRAHWPFPIIDTPASQNWSYDLLRSSRNTQPANHP